MFVRSKILFLAAALAVSGCTEKLTSANGCPDLCPQETIALRDTIIEGVLVDSSLTGFPPLGFEPTLILAVRGDTLDTRAIVRYDTLPQRYQIPGASSDSTINRIDSAFVRTPIVVPDSTGLPKAPVTLEVYNVSAAASDTGTAAILAQFTDANRLGSRTFRPESLTVKLPVKISTAALLAAVKNGTKFRIGLRVRSTASAELRVLSTASDSGTTISMYVSPDTAVKPLILTPLSATPADQPFTAGALTDFLVVAAGPPPPSSDAIRVGGVPGSRAYIRFDLPMAIVDSAAVVRATFLLTQKPLRASPRAGDRVYAYVLPLGASKVVTDIRTAIQFAGPAGSFGLDSVGLAPRDSGLRSLEIANLVRTWRLAGSDVPRAIALALSSESISTSAVDFFSREAAPAVRPRLRLTYVPRSQFGLP